MWFTRRNAVAPLAVGLAAAAVNLLQACGFEPGGTAFNTPAGIYEVLNSAPFTEPSASERWTVLDEPGRLRVEHGWSCASAPRALTGGANGKDVIGLGILETAELEDGYDATVFQNGWDLEYAGSDQQVVGLGSAIFNVYRVGSTLLWNAGGVLSDEGGDEAYRWCYRYTLLSWPKAEPRMDIDVVHSRPSGKLMFVDAASASAAGVVHALDGSYTSKGRRPRQRKPPRARLLTGFGLAWTHGDDEDVLQVGFDFGMPTFEGRTIRWRSSTVLKDDAANRSYRAAEVVSVLKGSSVQAVHPETVMLESGSGLLGEKPNRWTLAPRASSSCPNVTDGGSHVYHFVATGLAFRWGVPMLIGWDLGDQCEDNHVKRIGAWIEDFDYAWVAGEGGTLRYTVRTHFADDDGVPGIRDRVKIAVLGINPLPKPPLRPPPGPRG